MINTLIDLSINKHFVNEEKCSINDTLLLLTAHADYYNFLYLAKWQKFEMNYLYLS